MDSVKLYRSITGDEDIPDATPSDPISELRKALNFRIHDLDLKHCSVTVRDGKGGKDRMK